MSRLVGSIPPLKYHMIGCRIRFRDQSHLVCDIIIWLSTVDHVRDASEVELEEKNALYDLDSISNMNLPL